jgi:abortive infection bacteriophage resistance protein
LKTSFTNAPLSYEQQIELLKSKNLTIVNDIFCSKKLKHINYFRLSAYFPPFYEKEDRFTNEATFEDILKLYYFDKELRALFFYAIEKIEVYVRTQLAYTIAKNSGTFGYTDRLMFHNAKAHQDIVKTIKRETERSKEVFVEDFFNKYDEEYLPVYLMVEIASFSTLLKIFANMKEEYRKEIIQGLDIKPKVFKSWLHTITYVRNISAHHGRLWNKTLAIEPMKPKN